MRSAQRRHPLAEASVACYVHLRSVCLANAMELMQLYIEGSGKVSENAEKSVRSACRYARQPSHETTPVCLHRTITATLSARRQ